MFNVKEYSDVFVIRKEREDYVLKEYKGNVEGTLIIPNGITRISKEAFKKNKCHKIRKIIFPKTLKKYQIILLIRLIKLKKL